MGAAASISYVSPIETGGAVSTDQAEWPTGTAAGNTVVVQDASGISAAGGLSFREMYAGRPTDSGAALNPTGTLYVNQISGGAPFTIASGNAVSISSILSVINNNQISFIGQGGGNYDFALGSGAQSDGISVGAGAALKLSNVDDFSVQGSVSSAGDVTVAANTVVTGAVQATGGVVDLVAQNGALVGGVVAGADANVTIVANGTGEHNIDGTEITAGIISVGTVQNNGTGSVNLNSNGDIYVVNAGANDVGNIENASASGVMNIAGADGVARAGELAVDGTVNNVGTMNIVVDSLAVNGGDNDTSSILNEGDLKIDVENVANVGYGVNVSGMGANNTFELTAGSLDFASDIDADAAQAMFTNSAKSYTLSIGNSLNMSGIDFVNNAATDAGVGTSMSIAALNVQVDDILNYGSLLEVEASTAQQGGTATTDVDGSITVNGQIVGAADTETNVVAESNLTVEGAISNQGVMELNGADVRLGAISNSGANSELNITSQTSGGEIKIEGEVTNAGGNMLVNAEDISFASLVTNTGGVLDVKGSDMGNGPISFEALDVAGGTVNVDALIGQVTFGGNVTAPVADGQIDSNTALNVSGGVLNFGPNVYSVNSAEGVNIQGGLYAGSALNTAAGSVNIQSTMANSKPAFELTANGEQIVLGAVAADGTITGGDIIIDDDTNKRGVVINAYTVHAMGDVTVENSGSTLSLAANSLDVDGTVTVGAGNALNLDVSQIYTGSVDSNGKVTADTTLITADAGDMFFAGNLYMGVDDSYATSGLFVNGDSLALTTTGSTENDIVLGGAQIAEQKTLTLSASGNARLTGMFGNAGVAVMNAKDVSFAGIENDGMVTVVATGDISSTDAIDNNKNLTLTANDFVLTDVDNGDTLTVNSSAGTVKFANVANTDSMVVAGAKTIAANDIENTGGVMNLNATESISGQKLAVSGTGAKVTLNTAETVFSDVVTVAGDMMQGATDGMLNNLATGFAAGALDITNGGNLNFASGASEYDIAGDVSVDGAVNVASGAAAVVNANGVIGAGAVTNNAQLTLDAQGGMNLGNVVNNMGTMILDSNDAWTELTGLNVNVGSVVLYGAGARGAGTVQTDQALTQATSGVIANGINVRENDFVMDAKNLIVGSIDQKIGSMTINTNNVDVGGDIVAKDLRFVTSNINEWMSVQVDGNILGGTQFLGLGKMDVAGNYLFDANSALSAIIKPYAAGGASANNNYWATVNLNQDNTLGQITNAEGGSALINVNGVFKGGVEYSGAEYADGTPLKMSQIGITLQEAVDQGTAIWLLHANGGVEDFGNVEFLRNLEVRYCNADGSLCYDYLSSLDDYNDSDDDLPAYISVRDENSDGRSDSLYLVFDPRFGGPALVDNMKLQPIVARQPDHTNGEYVSAGALDNLIVGQLQNAKFGNRTPIEAIPLAFEGTALSEMANELYNRMEHYVTTSEGAPLARFSRLFQAYEMEQVAGALSLNEHTTFRSFEDRMLDEFIWNRNRNLRKAWLDVDYGMSYQDLKNQHRAKGNRFSVAGGFDWQDSETVILGLTGHVSRTSSKASDSMDLSYANNVAMGHSNVEVVDTNIGFGGYMLKTLGEKTRLYGNAFLDAHVFDINRDQNFVASIDGSGTAFSLISEWGLMHDILNQYVVGNVYARAGYNFGFDITEEIPGQDYMQLESDGYFVLTPGYTLMAQKRIYPSAWFQIRPYASIGIEYDIVGGPDEARYKFDAAKHYTAYDVDIDPLWANIGGGIEFLSAVGLQFGIDYRYQYNSDIQLHNIKVSGSYRF